jgi:lipopolysaccharide export system permease protein
MLGVLNRELVIPRVRDEITRESKDLGGGGARPLEARFDPVANILLGGDQIVLAERKIINPAFILLDPQLARFGKQLAAPSAYYVDANNEHAAGFVLTGVTLPEHIDRLDSLSIDGRLVVATSRDAAWLGTGEAFVASNVEFPLLASGSKWRTYASLPELIGELRRPSVNSGADIRVAIHSRLVQFLMDGTLVMLGLPVTHLL